jgi:6-phosphogluconate dehydrogenase
LLLDEQIAQLLQGKEQNLRPVAVSAIQNNYAAANLLTAISYFDAYRSGQLPINLVQAQRDYFGAHTYQRIDQPGTFHTIWNK